MMIDKAQAIEHLTPYLDLIRHWVADAETAYKGLDPGVRRVHSPRTRSSNISDYIKDYVYQTIIGQQDIQQKIKPIYRYGSLRLLIEDKFQLTFKKLDKNLRPSYWPTSRQTRFYSQDNSGQSGLAGMPPAVTNVYAGYQWEPLDDSRIYLVCPNGNRILWFVQLVESQEDQVRKAE